MEDTVSPSLSSGIHEAGYTKAGSPHGQVAVGQMTVFNHGQFELRRNEEVEMEIEIKKEGEEERKRERETPCQLYR